MLAWFFYFLQTVITLTVDVIVIASVGLYAFFALNFSLDILAFFKPTLSAKSTPDSVPPEKKND
jgi:hypothetical protein